MSIARVFVITAAHWLGLDLKYRLKRLGYIAETLVISGTVSIAEELHQNPASLVLLDSECLIDLEIINAIKLENIPVLCFDAPNSLLSCKVRLRQLNYVTDVQDEAILGAAIQAVLEQSQLKVQLVEQKAFVGAVDHEIRTPLSTLLLDLDLIEQLEHERLSGNSLQKLQTVERSRESVERIVQLLDRSKLLCQTESGELDWHPTVIHLPAFCAELIDEITQYSKTYPKVVLTEQYRDSEFIEFDETMLVQILTNLLNNAIKYSSEYSRVAFDLQVGSGVLMLRIQDQGIGIDPADCDRVFLPFHRGNNVAAIQGTGMGLAIVHRFVTFCRGIISTESELGAGTTITVTLPVKVK